VRGHLDVVKFLLIYGKNNERKIDINAKDDYAFRWACVRGHLDVVKFLLIYGKNSKSTIDINAKDDDAFRWACKNRHLEVAKFLSEQCERYQIRIENGIVIGKILDKYDLVSDDKLDEIEGSVLRKTENPCKICCSTENVYLSDGCVGTNRDHYVCAECIKRYRIGNKYKCCFCYADGKLYD